LAPPPPPDAVWVADITYVETAEGWLYAAGVLDRCARRCVGWAFDDTLATNLPLAALNMPCINDARLRGCCLTPIAGCNTPAPPTANAWRRRGWSPA
jgi:hypothetical protein